jgi:hypothetical protein
MMCRAFYILSIISLLAVSRPQMAEASEQHSIMMLSSKGISTAIDPRVVNIAPPSIELRYSQNLERYSWIEFDAGLALIAFPEHVPELRLGARIYPVRALTQMPVVRDFFLRAGASALLSIDGFDYAPNGEVGFAFSGHGIIFYVALSETYYIQNPRLVTDARIGAGFRF